MAKLNILELDALTAVITEAELEGAPHLIAPVVLLVEGVHNGVFYPAAELAKSSASWNGIPLTVMHPEDGNGNRVTANTPSAIKQYCIGRVFDVHYDSDNLRLCGTAWVNVAVCKDKAPEILHSLRQGRRLELSTGLWSDDDGAAGKWNDLDYAATVYNYRPDHLALLPGAKGACSWEDGCGVRVNVLSSARTPTFSGTESTLWPEFRRTLFEEYRDAYEREYGELDHVPASSADAPQEMKNWIASKTLLGEETAETDDELVMFPVINPRNGRLSCHMLRSLLAALPLPHLPTASQESAKAKMISLLDSHCEGKRIPDELPRGERGVEDGRSRPPAQLPKPRQEPQPNERRSTMDKITALVKEIAARLGVTNETSHDELRGRLQKEIDALDTEGWVHAVVEVYDDFVVYEARGTNPNEVGARTPVFKLYKRGFTVEDDAVTLSEEPTEVKQVTEYVPVTNDDATTVAEEKQPKEVDDMQKTELVDALIKAPTTRFTEESREALEGLDECMLQNMLPPDEPDTTTDKPAEGEDREGGGDKPPAAKVEPVVEPEVETNETPTVKEYIAAAPEEFRDTLTASHEAHVAKKVGLVDMLVANKRCDLEREELEAKSVKELTALVKLGSEKNFVGAAGAGETVLANAEDEVPKPAQTFDLSKK